MVDLDRLLPAPLLAILQETTVAVLTEILSSGELTLDESTSSGSETEPSEEKRVQALEKKLSWDSLNFRNKSLAEWMSSRQKPAAECIKVLQAVYEEIPESIPLPADFGVGGGISSSAEKALPHVFRILREVPTPADRDPRRLVSAVVWLVYSLCDSIGQERAAEILLALEPLLSVLQAKANPDVEGNGA